MGRQQKRSGRRKALIGGKRPPSSPPSKPERTVAEPTPPRRTPATIVPSVVNIPPAAPRPPKTPRAEAPRRTEPSVVSAPPPPSPRPEKPQRRPRQKTVVADAPLPERASKAAPPADIPKETAEISRRLKKLDVSKKPQKKFETGKPSVAKKLGEGESKVVFQKGKFPKQELKLKGKLWEVDYRPARGANEVLPIDIAKDKVGGFHVTNKYITVLDGGTPNLNPSLGVVINGKQQRIAIYDAFSVTARPKVYIGRLDPPAATFGIRGYAADGTTAIFELSTAINMIANWGIDNAKIYKSDANGAVALDVVTRALIIYSDDSVTQRVVVGHLGSNNYGFKALDGSGNVLAELGENQNIIADWTVNELYLAKDTGVDATSAGMAPTDYPFYAGAQYANRATAPFRVTPAGALTATSGVIAGSFYVGTGSDRIFIDGANKQIGSESFVSGPLGKGWRIDGDGRAEFQDVRVRGIIRSAVFEKDIISAVGGYMLVSNSDILSTDMTALDASTLTIEGNTTFALNEILRIKDGTDDEWLQVTNIGSAPTYTVTRDLAAAYGADANPIWKKGTAVVSTGAAAGGFISLDSSSANSPFIDIVLRNTATWNDTTTKVRLGNLAGITDADLGGALSGYGLYSDNIYLKGNITLASGTFKTNVANQRIVIDGTANNMIFYESGGAEVVKIDDNIIGATPGMDVTAGLIRVYYNSTNSHVILADGSSSYISSRTDLSSEAGYFENRRRVNAHTRAIYCENYVSIAPSYGKRRIGAWTKARGEDAVSTDDFIGIYAEATTAGSGNAWAAYFDAGNVNIQSLTASQDVQTDANKNLISVSDMTWKYDMGPVKNGLDTVMELKPHYFKWLRDANNNEIPLSQPRLAGFYAQEVYSVFPEGSPGGTNRDEDGIEHWGLNSHALLALLTRAVQEQQVQIEELKMLVKKKKTL